MEPDDIIENLTVLSMKNEKSDKVWGFFQVRAYSEKQNSPDHGCVVTWFRFWGRRTANYQTAEIHRSEALELCYKKIKDGYAECSAARGGRGNEVHELAHQKLRSQFVNQGFLLHGTQHYPESPGKAKDPVFSPVTSEKMAEGEIRPLDVSKTQVVGETIYFYNDKGESLGSRPLRQKESIFHHLARTKKSTPSGKIDVILWT